MSEWGPWQRHDGKGCPCKGYFGEFEFRNGSVISGVAWTIAVSASGAAVGGNVKTSHDCWVWSDGGPRSAKVVRYRIRKPKGLTILENLIAEIPEEVAG